MSELSLVYPMLALVLLTFGVLIVLFRSRVRMVREGLAPVSYFRTFQGSVVNRNLRSSPPGISPTCSRRPLSSMRAA